MINRTSVREARKNLSQTLNKAEAVSIGSRYGPTHGFIVGVPEHNHWDSAAKCAALRKAKTAFQKLFMEEWNG